MNRREWWLPVFSVAVGAVSWIGLRAVGLAGPPHAHFSHRQKTHTRNGLPCHAYGKDSEVARDVALASADPVRPVTWLEGTTSPINRRANERTSFEELPPPRAADSGNQDLSRVVRRKPFHVHATSITAAGASLQQIALSLYDTGQLQASGKLVHTGGTDGGLLGNNVSIRLRAYSAPTVPAPEELPIDSELVWQSERKLWVARNQPISILLVPPDPQRDRELRRFFNEITHFEVELITHQDR
jgi:hypothetical protein